MLNRLIPLLVYLVLVLADVPGHGLSIAQNRVGNFFEASATLPPENPPQAVQRHRENGAEYGKIASGRCQLYLTDRLGSVTGITDATGALINSTTYDSYGHILSQSNPAVADALGFTGREFDAETGLYYFRARYYNPDLGAFQSEDPVQFRAGDFNVSRYVTNSPLDYLDPSGLGVVEDYEARQLSAQGGAAEGSAVARSSTQLTEAARAALGKGPNAIPGQALTAIQIAGLDANLDAAVANVARVLANPNIAGAERIFATGVARIQEILRILESGVGAPLN